MQQRQLWTGQVQPTYEERSGSASGGDGGRSREHMADLKQRYISSNRAPSIILDNHDVQALPAFW